MKRESLSIGVIFTLLSSGAMSLVGLFGKLGAQVFSLTGLIFWRFVSGFVLCFLWIWICGGFKEKIQIKDLRMHILRACLVLGAQYSYYYYIERGTLLNGTMLLCTGPLFIPLIEWIFLRKVVAHSNWITLLVSFIGVILILQPDRDIFNFLSAMGLFSGICQGGSQVVFGINAKEKRADLGILYLMFFCALFSLIPYLLAKNPLIQESSSVWMSIFLILGLGFASVTNNTTRAIAYRHGSPSKLAVFLYFSVLLAGFYDWWIFHIVPDWLSLVGAILVVLGGVLKIYLHIYS